MVGYDRGELVEDLNQTTKHLNKYIYIFIYLYIYICCIPKTNMSVISNLKKCSISNNKKFLRKIT